MKNKRGDTILPTVDDDGLLIYVLLEMWQGTSRFRVVCSAIVANVSIIWSIFRAICICFPKLQYDYAHRRSLLKIYDGGSTATLKCAGQGSDPHIKPQFLLLGHVYQSWKITYRPPTAGVWVITGIDWLMHCSSWQHTMLANNTYLLSCLIKRACHQSDFELPATAHLQIVFQCPSLLKMPSCPCCSNHTKLFSGGWDRSRFLYCPLCLLACFSIAVSQLLRAAFIGFKHMPLLQIQKHSGSVRAHSHQAKDNTWRVWKKSASKKRKKSQTKKTCHEKLSLDR